MIFNYFEKSFYINLDERQDRKLLFEKRASKLDFNIERFNAIKVPNNFIDKSSLKNEERRKQKLGCSLSHFEIIRQAKENKLKNVLIFEDDCVFVDNFNDKLLKCVNELKNKDWDLFYLGGEPNALCDKAGEYIYKMNNGGAYSTHAYAINNCFFDKILSINPYNNITIDIIYLNYSKSDRNYFISKDILVYQDDELFSDLWGQVIKRKDTYESAYKKYII